MTDEQKAWIDNASYKVLLSRWRFAPVGDEIFQGEAGTYYKEVMFRKKDELGQSEHVKVSKEIGWGK